MSLDRPPARPLTPRDWQGMSWHARRRYARQRAAPEPPRGIADLAREMEAHMPPDPNVKEHLAALDHYTSRPRKRTT